MLAPDLGLTGLALRGAGRPSLWLDFAGGTYGRAGETSATFAGLGGVSFSRAGAGTAWRADGSLAAFAAGVPRITDRGWLQEAARTNSARYSNAFGQSAWVKDGATVSQGVLSPSGALDGWTLTETATTAEHRIYQDTRGANVAGRAESVFAKAGTAGFLGVSTGLVTQTAVFDLNAGTVSSVVGGVATIAPAAHGWFWLTYVPDGAGRHMTLNMGMTSAQARPGGPYAGAGGFVHLYQADDQLGPAAGSPIGADATVATRGAEAAAVIVPPGATTFRAVHGDSGTVTTGAVTPGASFDLTAGRPWIGPGQELKRLEMR